LTETNLPKNLLVPVGGAIARSDGEYSIRIDLKPFELDGELVTTAFILDGVYLDEYGFSDLAGNEFEFPVNPDEGYIDGSIYLRHVHNPVDVTQIAFGEYRGDSIDATFTMRVLFEFEGSGFRDMDCTVTTRLRISENEAA
jgi:hypothetical protein